MSAFPFFEQPGSGSPRGRLLLLSWHFPPAQSAGALRWQKLADHAAQAGWALDVITVAPEVAGTPDLSRLHGLPAGTRVFGVLPRRSIAGRVDAWRAARAKRSLGVGGDATPPVGPASKSRVAAAKADPSAASRAWNAWLAFSEDRAWTRQAQAVAESVIGSDHKAVISCGPPHLVHTAALNVGRRHGLCVAMDLRDPWASRRRVPAALDSPLWFALAAYFQRKTLPRADVVFANTDALATSLRSEHPGANIVTVMNGYDDEILPEAIRGERFVLAYAGAIYLDRDPRPLFRAVVTAAKRLGVGPDRLGIELVGRVADFGGVSLTDMAAEVGAAEFVRLSPSVPRREALQFLANAQMLVSLPQDSRFAIPSKVFEYMQFRSWILALADKASPSARLLEGSEADVVDPTDVEAISGIIERRARSWWSGEVPPRLAENPAFSRRYQASILFRTLGHALEARAGS